MTLHTYPNIDQGTDEWMDQRRGLITASVVGKLITLGAPDALTVRCPTCQAPADGSCVHASRKTPIKTIHSERSAKASNMPPVFEVADNDTSKAITLTLATERIAGWTEDLPMTADMWRGKDAEPFARDIYSDHYGEAREVGFMRRDEDGWRLGYSPDGLVGIDGLIEIKSPRAKTHVRTILADEVPSHYMAQCQAGLLVSGRKWCDFVSYVGGLPLYVKRVNPDAKWFAAITAACIQFEMDASQIVADYRTRVAGMPTTERIDFNQVELKLA